jgi:transposase
MGARLRLDLTADQRAELEHMRDHHPRPYLRERAAALLKIADGMSGTYVAAHGLLRYRKQETLYAWVHRYQAHGLPGLFIRTGRGRKPAFSPCV